MAITPEGSLRFTIVKLALMLCVGLIAACSESGPPPPVSPVAFPTPPAHFATGGVVEYPVPDASNLPAGCPSPCPASLGSVAAGPDGNVWFVDVNRSLLERITPAGVITVFPLPAQPFGGAQTIAAGPDHNVWVTAGGSGSGQPDWILRVTKDGVSTKFSVGVGTAPESIAPGPDGNLWFTEVLGSRVGRLTPSGSLTEYPTLTGDAAPRGIVAGLDGNMWFVESGRGRPAVARITTGGQITEFPLTQGPSDVGPFDIVQGADRNMWFTQTGGIGHISPTGDIVNVPLPQGSAPRALAAGPDGNIWFTDEGLNAIGRLGTSGALREYSLPRRASNPTGIAVGGDGRIWFTEAGYASVASIGLKVPEAQINRRPLIFIDSSSTTVPVRNTGDAPLDIKRVRVAGVDAANFSVRRDGCSGVSLPPDAGCSVEVAPAGGGAPGVQSASLEFIDDATGSPQKISLVAQVPICSLPVTVDPGAGQPRAGEFLDTKAGQVLYDPSGRFAGTGETGVQTVATPVLTGVTSGYYDTFARRWLPVAGASAISPDGSRYAYFTLDLASRDHLHLVDVATGAERLLALPSAAAWGVVAFTAEGVYVNQGYEGIGPGLWLVDPDTGAFKTVSGNLVVQAVDGNAAWVPARNPVDKLPQPPGQGATYDEIDRHDLKTGTTTPWFYMPGTDLSVAAVVNGLPVILVRDAESTTYWIVTAANQARRIDLPLTVESGGIVTGFAADPAGMWVGTSEGVYLWTSRTGGVLITNEPAVPAGTCG